jgi:integrase/recombinase XerD
MCADAGLNQEIIKSISGHSMRVGAAQDMMSSGLGILPIMQAGGWKSMNVVGRYVQYAEFSALALRRNNG